MSGAGILCHCGCDPPCPCPGIECEHCVDCTPSELTLTFTGVSLTECIEPTGTDFTYRLVGDFGVINGTFCVAQPPPLSFPCDWTYEIPLETLKVMKMQDGNCELVLEEGAAMLVMIRVCRSAGKWNVSVVGFFDVAEAVMFYAEIATANCRTGGVASSQLASGDGSVFDIPGCSAFDAGGGFEQGSGGSVTLSICCD